MFYDVLIVGAGPAGSSTAMVIAQQGRKVLIVDRKRVIGEPVRCAEFVPRLLAGEVSISKDCIANEVESMITHFPDGESYKILSPGFILNRALFDRTMIIEALRAGAELWIDTRFVRFSHGKALVVRGGELVEVAAKVVVGADGPVSSVGKMIGETNKDFVFGLEYQIPLMKNMSDTQVYFSRDFFGGYAWLFPKERYANVGVGIKLKRNCYLRLKNLLDQFIKKLKKEEKIIGSPVSLISGLIPVGGPLKTVKENILLVGDAAGQTHPITGAGIAQAIICGKIAGEAIVQAVKSDNIKKLLEYEKNWQKLYYSELKRATEKRHFLERNWGKLNEVLKRCWVVFPEYYG
uniref:NAD(P)/FAD-dependent oxidoreductase n=1 Tax=candidate division WOR-3 bacterium TaxID=2052148 RepID=A0A7C4XJV1_UNCW3